LVNDIGQAGDQAKADRADVDLGSAPKLEQDERDDGQTGHRVSIKILRPRIVKAIQVKLEQRRQRPDSDGGENGAVSSGELTDSFVHGDWILPCPERFGRCEPDWHWNGTNLLACAA
jgi:hypothetical protein